MISCSIGAASRAPERDWLNRMKPLYNIQELKAARLKTGHVHSRFGDLNRKSAVKMPAATGHKGYEEQPFSFVHLSVTGRCNARCSGCINGLSLSNGGLPDGRPAFDMLPERDGEAIRRLLPEMEEEEVVLCLYGGEPLLALDRIERLYEILPTRNGRRNVRFMIYTNGQLLDHALTKHRELMSRIWLFSVSIDGRTDQHNSIRIGTDLNKIWKNMELLKEIRRGPLLMWSTLREGQSLLDCFEEFVELYKDGLADHFFWHWVETKEAFHDFPRFLACYEEDLRRIMDTYTEALSQGKLFSIVHVNELILYLLTGRKRKTTGCGIEADRNFDIVGGNIYACADLPLSEPIGRIGEDGAPHFFPHDLSQFTAYKEDLGCTGCGVHNYCGGRCPVQALMSEAERLIQYCQLMRLHVGVVMDYLPRIKTLLEQNGIGFQSLYDNSAFFAQFTDVTP